MTSYEVKAELWFAIRGDEELRGFYSDIWMDYAINTDEFIFGFIGPKTKEALLVHKIAWNCREMNRLTTIKDLLPDIIKDLKRLKKESIDAAQEAPKKQEQAPGGLPAQ